MATTDTPITNTAPEQGAPAPTIINVAPGAPTAPTVTPGKFTSEHAMFYIVTLINTLVLCDVLPVGSWPAKALFVAATYAGQLGYTIGRSIVKSSAHKVAVAETSAATTIANNAVAFGAAGLGAIATSRRAQGGFARSRVVRGLAAFGILALAAFSIGAQLGSIGCATSTKEKAATTAKAMSGDFVSCGRADLGQLLPSGLTALGDVSQKIRGNDSALEDDLTSLAKTLGLDAVDCAVKAVVEVLAPAGVKSTGQETPGVARARAWLHSVTIEATVAK